jgi:hypothetical protein
VHLSPSVRALCGCIAALLLALAAPTARADEQVLRYQLLAQDRAVGSRDVTIKYVPTPTGELRLLEAWTSFVLPIPKGTFRYEQRLGARFGGDRGFVASMSLDGQVREVQARQGIDGAWAVSRASAQGAHSEALPTEAVDLVSSEIFDGQRALRALQAGAQLSLLSAETGTVLSGPVTDLGPGTMAVGPDEIEVLRYRFEPPEGTMTLAYSRDGWLIAYDYQVLGLLVGARLQKLPPPRSFDTVLDGSLTGDTIQEEAL